MFKDSMLRQCQCTEAYVRTFTIPGLDAEFYQHDVSQAVSEDAYYLYLKAKCGLELETRTWAASSDLEVKYDVLDLGTGNGILLLMLAKDFRNACFTGIEIVKELCDIAIQNFIKLGDYLKEKMQFQIINANYSNLEQVLTNRRFDMILSNPPYYSSGTGKLSSDFIKAVARFEISATLVQLLSCIKSYLAVNGKSFVVFPYSRWNEFEENCRQLNLKINSYDFVDYKNQSFHKDIKNVNYKTKIIYELTHA